MLFDPPESDYHPPWRRDIRLSERLFAAIVDAVLDGVQHKWHEPDWNAWKLSWYITREVAAYCGGESSGHFLENHPREFWPRELDITGVAAWVEEVARLETHEAEHLVRRMIAKRERLIFQGGSPRHFQRVLESLLIAIPSRLASASSLPIKHPQQLFVVLLGKPPIEFMLPGDRVAGGRYLLGRYLGYGMEGERWAASSREGGDEEERSKPDGAAPHKWSAANLHSLDGDQLAPEEVGGDVVLELSPLEPDDPFVEPGFTAGYLGDLLVAGRKPGATDALHMLHGPVGQLAAYHKRYRCYGCFHPWNIGVNGDGSTMLGGQRSPVWKGARQAGWSDLPDTEWPGRFLGRGSAGAALYVAPEMFKGRAALNPDGKARIACDVFSVGVVLLQLCLGDLTASPHLLEEADWHEAELDEEIIEILRGCLRRHPSKRFATAEQILQKIKLYLQKSDRNFRKKQGPAVESELEIPAVLLDTEGEVRPTTHNDSLSCMARAAFNLGKHYERKKSDPEARKASAHFYLKAARSGHLGAQNNYAAKEMQDGGRELDRIGAHRTFVHAAEEGNPTAMFNAAEDYLLGRGTVKDEESALFWYQRAARAGFRPAYLKLKELEASGVGSPNGVAVRS